MPSRVLTRLKASAAGLWSALGPGVRRMAGAARRGVFAALAPVIARLGPRRTAAAGGAVALAIVVLAVALGGGRGPAAGPDASPGASRGPGESGTPGASAGPVADPFAVLPSPATTDIALLVADAARLSAREQQWLNDLRGSLGKVDAVGYRDATVARMRAYFVIYVIDRSGDLDPGVLGDAYRAGRAVHLVGAAAGYEAAIKAGATPAAAAAPSATPFAIPSGLEPVIPTPGPGETIPAAAP